MDNNAKRSGLMELLHDATARKGYLAEEVVEEISFQLNLPSSHIFGLASQFSELPIEKVDLLVKVCAGPCCALRGSLDLVKTLKVELSTFKGKVRVEEAYGLPYWHLPIALEVSGRGRKEKIFHAFDTGKITILKKTLLGEATKEDPAPIYALELKNFASFSKDNYSLLSVKEEGSLKHYRQQGGMSGLEKAITDSKKTRRALDQSGLADFYINHPLSEDLNRLLQFKPSDRMIICDAGSREVENGLSGMAASYNPYAVLEGMLVIMNLYGISQGAIYLPWKDIKSYKALNKCLGDLTKEGFTKDARIEIFRGPAHLACMRDIGVAAVIEGRMLGDKAAEAGFTPPRVLGKEALQVSAETLSKIPVIIQRGGANYKKSGGTALITITGKTGKSRVEEAPLSISIGELAQKRGGLSALKALHLHGSSGGPFPPERFGMKLGYRPGEGFGGTGPQVLAIGEDKCMVRWAEYLAHLSGEMCCGACIPGRNTPGAVERLLGDIASGKAKQNTMAKIASLIGTASETALCPQVRMTLKPILLAMEYFQGEFMAHVEEKSCPAGECKSKSK